MTNHEMGSNRIALGDPVPWFSAPVVTGGAFDLHVSAGRWVVLSFLGSPANPRAIAEIAELARASSSLDEDQVIVGCVFTGQPDDAARLAATNSSKLFFLADYDGAISRSFGAHEMPRTVVLDPMLRAVADIAWDVPQGHAETVGSVLRGLPSVDDSAGVPMFAPTLMVPRVFISTSAISWSSSMNSRAASIPASSSTWPARPQRCPTGGSSAAATSG
jgi:peroxiredoxin